MTVLEARSVRYSVGGTALVSGVDFALDRGEVVAVIGPNGAGKSTLLSLLAGDLPPSGGSILLGGVPIEEIPATDLALYRAVLAQNTPPDIPFPARAVVAFGRYPHRRNPANTSEIDTAEVNRAMERTETTHLTDRVFATLSGGERTRVNLARVFAQAAPILLLDEPTTALDPAHEERVMGELRQSARQDRGVVAVLHDLNAAAAFADRVVLMADAAVRAEGTPLQVFTDELLTDVYGQPMRVIDHPFRDCPLVLHTD